MTSNSKQDVHFQISEDLKERLDQLAEKSGMNRSSIMRKGVLNEIIKLESDLDGF